MKNEKLYGLIKEIEKTNNSDKKEDYLLICNYISEIKTTIVPLYNLSELLKELDNIQYMMNCYLPKNGLYDKYGTRQIHSNESNVKDLARQKKRLIISLNKLKTYLGDIRNLEEKEI